MTRSSLVEQVSVGLRIPRARAEQIVTLVFDSLEQALMRGGRIEIRGFGTFEVRHYDGYLGRNPRTGETTHVKPKRLPFFKVGTDLRERVNAGARVARPPVEAPHLVPPLHGPETGGHRAPAPPGLHIGASRGEGLALREPRASVRIR